MKKSSRDRRKALRLIKRLGREHYVEHKSVFERLLIDAMVFGTCMHKTTPEGDIQRIEPLSEEWQTAMKQLQEKRSQMPPSPQD